MKSKKIGVITLTLMILCFSFSFVSAAAIPATLTAGEVGESEFLVEEDLPHQSIGALQSSLFWSTDFQIKNDLNEIIFSQIQEDYVKNIELILMPAGTISDENLFDSLTYPDVFLVSDDGLSITQNAEVEEIIFGADGQDVKNLGDSMIVNTLSISLLNFDGTDGDLLVNGASSTWDWYADALNPPSISELSQAYGPGISDVHSIVISEVEIIVQVVVFDQGGIFYWIAKENDEVWDLTTSTMHYGFSSSTDNYEALAFAPSGNYDSWILI